LELKGEIINYVVVLNEKLSYKGIEKGREMHLLSLLFLNLFTRVLA
jgi:hypothetical protein